MVQKGIYRVERTYDCLAANAAEKKAQRRKIARFKVFLTKTDGNKIWPPVVSNLLAVHGHSYHNYQVYKSKVLL